MAGWAGPALSRFLLAALPANERQFRRARSVRTGGAQRACAGREERRGAARAGGTRAGDLAHVRIPRDWPPAEAPGGPWRSLSLLTEDGTDGSVPPGVPEVGPLSSTRRSLLEELELGGGCGLGEPPLWPGCPPEPPSLAPRPRGDFGDPALPLQPLASSTLLGDELGEGSPSWTTGGPTWAVPKPSAGDSPLPQRDFGPGGSLSSPQPCSRVGGGQGVSRRAPQLRGGLGGCCLVWQSPGDGDIPGAGAQHCASVPQGPVVGWGGLGTAAPRLGTMVREVGAGGWDRSSLGDSSGGSERFVTAVEILEPSEAGGCLGAQRRCSPQPRAAPSSTGAATQELPPASPPSAGGVQGEDFWGGSGAAPRCEDGSEGGDVGGLLVQLQGCSLRGSPPPTPEPPCSPASLAMGDVTPRGPDPPVYRHVTPRTKSRLQASAARLNASSSSSSSSLFDKTLEMPRRPPRLRVPWGVPRDPPTPSGHCITPGGEDAVSGDSEGTGSLDDTEILPRAPTQPRSPPGTSSSPGSSPTVLLVLGDHAGSTAAEPGSPLSPAGRSTHYPGEHPEDEEQGQGPTERHSPGTGATTSPQDTAVQVGRASPVPLWPLSDEGLRRRLRALGDDPGPVTELTRRLYLRRLEKLTGGPCGTPPAGPGCTAVGLTVLPDARAAAPGHSPELVAALQTGRVPDCAQDELALARQFDRPDRSRHWREGLCKYSFNYLLLDPRTTQNLPLRSPRLSPAECFRTFVEAIFYVGKGTRTRPYCHLAEALSQHRTGTHKGCPKVRRILEIWASGQGVISVHCFQNSVPAEAYTREGCLVEALGLQTLTNQRKGNCYGVAASWPAERRRRLGVHMLHRAMSIFLAEGERQLRPADIQGGR
ncbi:ankyrin repeat and LEM domain-containing protein 1 [Pterocles gutturalis]